MARVGRIVIAGCPHHVTQRGSNRQDVFFVDDDRRAYLAILREQAQRFGVVVEGYCLMTNHVHLIVTPSASLDKAIGRTNFHYTQWVNRLHRRCGHLWQNRFFSCALDGEHYWAAMAYVERNPVRAKLVRQAWRWPWSSAAAHCGGSDGSGLLNLASWRRAVDGDWRERLSSAGDADVDSLRLSTSRGRPLGSDGWLSKLEATLGRRLRALPVGRPRNEEGK
jgi:putative transposase